MYSIYLSLLNYSYSMQSDRKVKVFLHTSCVMDNDLERLFSSSRIRSRFCFILMNDCYYETKLLTKSRIDNIGKNAQLILKSCARYIDGNMREHYRFHKASGKPNIIQRLHPSKNNEYIFAFYNPSAAEEFLLNTVPSAKESKEAMIKSIDLSPMNHIKILTFNKQLNNRIDYEYSYTSPVPLTAFTIENFSKWKLWRAPQAVNVSPGDRTDECEVFYINLPSQDKVLAISREQFADKCIAYGGHAKIYSVENCEELRGKVLKIFNNKYRSAGNKKNSSIVRNYLLELKEYKKIFGDRIALPDAIITDEKGEVVGFVMKYFENLTTVNHLSVVNAKNLMIDMAHYAPETKSRELALLLLEMSLFQLKMTDISYTNICCTEEKHIVIVDADSIESRSFIFSQYFITPTFTNRRLITKNNNLTLGKTPTRSLHFSDIYSDFSFAVMLYYLYYTNSPLDMNGKNYEITYPNWKIAKEKGITSVTRNRIQAPQPLKMQWESGIIPEKRRLSFVNHFSGDTIYTIGQWIDVLDLE